MNVLKRKCQQGFQKSSSQVPRMRNGRVDDVVILGCMLDFFLSVSFCPSLVCLQVIFRNLSATQTVSETIWKKGLSQAGAPGTPSPSLTNSKHPQPPAAQLSSGIQQKSQSHFGEDVKMWDQPDIRSGHQLPRMDGQGSKARGQGMSSRRL